MIHMKTTSNDMEKLSNSADENLPQKPSDILVFLPQGLKKKIKIILHMYESKGIFFQSDKIWYKKVSNSADENLPQKHSDILVFLPQGLEK